VRFGLSLASDSDQTRFSANLSHRATWVNRLGAELRNDLQLGYRDRLTSEFHQPVSFRAGAFVAPRIDVRDEPITFYLQGRRLGGYRVTYTRTHLDVGVQNPYGEVRVGVFAGSLSAEEDFGLVTGPPNYHLTQVGHTAHVVFDQVDNPRFAHNGVLAELTSFSTEDAWGSDDDHNRTELFLLGAKRFGRHAVQVAALHGDSLYGEVQVYDPFLLGGFLRGSGYRMDELLGDRVSMARGRTPTRSPPCRGPWGAASTWVDPWRAPARPRAST
jgi:NTE family protein